MNKQIRNTIIFLIIATPLSILLVYGQWSYLFSDFKKFLELFNVWSWFKMSIVLTAITYLSSYTILWFYTYYEKELRIWEVSIIYVVCVMPVGILIFHPGINSFDYDSSSLFMVSILILYVIHSFGMKIFLTNLDYLSEINTKNNHTNE